MTPNFHFPKTLVLGDIIPGTEKNEVQTKKIASGIPKNPYFDPSHVSVASFYLISEGVIQCPPLQNFPFFNPNRHRVNLPTSQVSQKLNLVRLAAISCNGKQFELDAYWF